MLDDIIVGFGAAVWEKGELRACYVSADVGRQGIGRKIVEAIEAQARHKGLTYLLLDSFLTAEHFYGALGYKLVERGQHKLRSGLSMPCVKMRKEL